MWYQPAWSEKSWPPFCQIWIIFTHLKLWIDTTSSGWKFKLNDLAIKGLGVVLNICYVWSPRPVELRDEVLLKTKYKHYGLNLDI